jgi:hypothetical protein
LGAAYAGWRLLRRARLERLNRSLPRGQGSDRWTLAADQMVIELGSVPNFHDIPGVAERSLTMKSLGDAAVIRNHALEIQPIHHTERLAFEAPSMYPESSAKTSPLVKSNLKTSFLDRSGRRWHTPRSTTISPDFFPTKA